jgi:hypothetical protein
MGGFLESLGRSNAFTSTNNLMGTAINLKQMQNQEEAAAAGNAINLEKLDILKRSAAIQQAEEDRKALEFKEKKDAGERFFPASYFGIDVKNPDPSQKQLIADLTAAKIVSTDGSGAIGIRAKDAPLVNEYYTKFPERQKALAITKISQIDEQFATGKLKPEEKSALLETRQMLEASVRKINSLTKGTESVVLPKGSRLVDPTSGEPLGGGSQDESGPDFEKSAIGQIEGANGTEYLYPRLDGKGIATSSGDTYDPAFHGPYQKVGSEPKNDFTVFMEGMREKNPDVTSSEISAAWHKLKREEAAAAGETRGAAFAKSRPVNVLDTYNGNRPITVSLADVQANPERYITAGGGEKALNKTALVEDIRGNITNTRNSLKSLKTEFTATQRAQIAYVLKSADTKSAISSFMQGSVASTLTPDQVDYVTDLFQLHENGMAMRSVLGAGQGSDELRAAIRATIPGGNTPTRAYAGKQLDKFEQVLNRLSAGIPKVSLRTDVGETQTKPAAPIAGNWVFKGGKWVQE